MKIIKLLTLFLAFIPSLFLSSCSIEVELTFIQLRKIVEGDTITFVDYNDSKQSKTYSWGYYITQEDINEFSKESFLKYVVHSGVSCYYSPFGYYLNYDAETCTLGDEVLEPGSIYADTTVYYYLV